jgi:hypothetical protein
MHTHALAPGRVGTMNDAKSAQCPVAGRTSISTRQGYEPSDSAAPLLRGPYGSRVTDDAAPEHRLEKARQREHVVSAVARAQSEWRNILEALEAADSAEAAPDVLQQTFGLTREQAVAVMDMQFRRVARLDRDRIFDELAALRAEIAELEDEQ